MTSEEFQTLVLNSLGKLNQEITDLKTGQQQLETKVSQDIESFRQDMTQTLARIENDQGEKIKALFDAREVQIDEQKQVLGILERIEGKLDNVSFRVLGHESVLKKVKKIK